MILVTGSDVLQQIALNDSQIGQVAAVLHGLGTGTDATNELFLLLNVAAVAGVLVAFLAFRVAEGWPALGVQFRSVPGS